MNGRGVKEASSFSMVDQPPPIKSNNHKADHIPLYTIIKSQHAA